MKPANKLINGERYAFTHGGCLNWRTAQTVRECTKDLGGVVCQVTEVTSITDDGKTVVQNFAKGSQVTTK